MENNPEKTEEKLDQFQYNRFWEYFKYHAEQRIQTFKFFFVMQSVILSGFITFFFKNITVASNKLNALQKFSEETTNLIVIPHITIAWIILGLGLLLILFSIIFWGLDYRNNTMITRARGMLIKMENDFSFNYKIFAKIEKYTIENNSIRFGFWIKLIFLIFILIGLLIVIFGLNELLC